VAAGLCRPWKVVPAPEEKDAGLDGVSGTSSTDVWAVGDVGGSPPYIIHWDGSTWTQTVQSEIDGSLLDVEAISPTDAWAVGHLSGADARTLVEHWDGTAWTVVDSPSPGFIYNHLTAVSAVAPNDVWAAGIYGPPEGGTQPLFLHWDGTSWTQFPEPDGTRLHGASIHALEVVSASEVWAVGYRGVADPPLGLQPLVERWNGTQWEIVRTPNAHGEASSYLNAVAAVSSDDVWAVGTNNDGYPIAFRWNGGRWRQVALGGGTGVFNGVGAVAADDVWAVGSTYDFGEARYIPTSAHWDGGRWKSVPAPRPGLGSGFGAMDVVSAGEIWAVGTQDAQTASYPLTMRSRGMCT
jgi:hypothetical protein